MRLRVLAGRAPFPAGHTPRCRIPPPPASACRSLTKTTSLDEYVSRMKEGQKQIYYLAGACTALRPPTVCGASVRCIKADLACAAVGLPRAPLRTLARLHGAGGLCGPPPAQRVQRVMGEAGPPPSAQAPLPRESAGLCDARLNALPRPRALPPGSRSPQWAQHSSYHCSRRTAPPPPR